MSTTHSCSAPGCDRLSIAVHQGNHVCEWHRSVVLVSGVPDAWGWDEEPE